ncbi:Innexin [Trichostrongylus colubriformis]|uniref:Innexin n=2 Tax=Trichostrongylus colubriformis TaxID=6319 RepID=A0AAN8EME5_TRICO
MFGSSLASMCYVVTKWLQVVNGFGQLYMLACFVGEGDYLWGLHLLHTVLNGTDNPNAGIFPRIVLCDVTKFALANMHKVNMQCVLMLNFINEKIYTFLWFWIVFVTLASTLSAIRQTVALVFPVYRSLLADSFLPTQDVLFSNALAEHGVRPTPVTSRALVDYFIHKILRCDGVLLLSFINGNVGGLVTHDIAHQLWKITVQPSFKISGTASTDSTDGPTKKKDSLYWPDYHNIPETVRKMGVCKRLEAAGDPQGTSFNNNSKHPAQPMARTRALSVGNLETEVPTAPMESSPLISEGSTQAVDDSTCPIQSLRASPGSNRRRLTNVYPGVALVDNRHLK